MNVVLEEFLTYAGLAPVPPHGDGPICLRFESGMHVTIEADARRESLLITAFVPCPWGLVEAGEQILKLVNYKKSPGRPIAAGLVHDHLVLSTRLAQRTLTPQEMESAMGDLWALVEYGAQQVAAASPAVLNDGLTLPSR